MLKVLNLSVVKTLEMLRPRIPPIRTRILKFKAKVVVEAVKIIKVADRITVVDTKVDITVLHMITNEDVMDPIVVGAEIIFKDEVVVEAAIINVTR